MTAPDERAVLGVDGAAGAWVAALQTGPGALPTLHWCADFRAVAALATSCRAAVVGVDMPIGLAAAGHREADRAARTVLGVRRSTLFPTPAHLVLDAVDYEGALALSRTASGKGLSIQAWNLMPAIRQVREVVLSGPAGRYIEVHPETSFTLLAGEPLESKRSETGIAARLALLAEAFPGLGGSDPRSLVEAPPSAKSRPKADDVLDALIVAWSARRRLDGTATVFGEGTDPDGLALQIVA